MDTKTRNIVLGVIFIAALIAIGHYAITKSNQGADTTSMSTSTFSTSNAATSTTRTEVVQTSAGKITVSGIPQGVTITAAPTKNVAAPDYMKVPVFSADTSADVKAAILAKVQQSQTALSKNKQDFDAWMSLGLYYKTAGDYKAAEAIWLYVDAAWPTNITTPNNLGDLYANYLKDYPKAEMYYLKLVAHRPDLTQTYRDLADLYTYHYHPTPTAAEDILKKGIKANPDALDLQVLLARFYKSAGRTAEAKAAFDVAIATAKAAGNTDAAAQLTQESQQ